VSIKLDCDPNYGSNNQRVSAAVTACLPTHATTSTPLPSRTQSCYEMTTAMHDSAYSAYSGNGTVALQLLGMTGHLPVVDFHGKRALSGPTLNEMDANFVAAAPERCEDRCNNKGWCSVHGFCVCFFGFKGRTCGEVDNAVYCSNSCSSHGVCMSGFCQCDKGFFGTDCSLTKADDGTTLTSYAPGGSRGTCPDVVRL
jgi:hypothetical protein